MRDNKQLIIDYADQLIGYFAVIEGLKNLYVVSFRPESKVKKTLILELTTDSSIYRSNAAKAVPEKISVLSEQLKDRSKLVSEIVKSEIQRISF